MSLLLRKAKNSKSILFVNLQRVTVNKGGGGEGSDIVTVRFSQCTNPSLVLTLFLGWVSLDFIESDCQKVVFVKKKYLWEIVSIIFDITKLVLFFRALFLNSFDYDAACILHICILQT